MLTSFLASGCTVEVDGQAFAAPHSTGSVSLPFVPAIAERINDRNDGTTFEPCVAYTSPELNSLGVIPGSVNDAAFSDSPNFRGCDWASRDSLWAYTQTVGNEKSLESYKAKQDLRQWNPDRIVNGRTVGIALDPPLGCIAVFISQRAILVSAVRSTTKRTPEPDYKTECDMAVAFATLATTKAP